MLKRLFVPLMLVLSFMLVACQPAATSTPPPTTKKFNVNEFVGYYEGTWTNSKTGATGPATFDFVADEAAHTVALTLDMGGDYLGLGDIPPATLHATYDDYLARIQGNDLQFGEMDVTIDGDGNINGVFKNVAAGMVPLLTYKGKVGNGHIDTTYVVTLPDGSTADAVLVADRK